MAAPIFESFGYRQLWQIISGTGSLRPKDYVEYELNKNKDKLLQGFLFFKKPSPSQAQALKRERKLKPTHIDFVQRLSQLLCLDELQSYDLFCDFLLSEYRGSQRDLLSTLQHERYSQSLLLKIRDYYHGERLYLLRCIRHILHCWLEGEHVYKDAFAKFLNELLEKNLLGKKLIEQFDQVCNAPLPNKELNGHLMGRGQVLGWCQQNLKEQVELLELLVVYYKDFEMDMDTLLSLHSRCKSHCYGWGQSYKHLIDQPMEKLVHRIGYLEVLLMLEGLDIISALTSKEENKLSDHVILSSSENVEKLESAVSKLGSEAIHAPLLLGCSILLHMHSEVVQSKEDRDAGDVGPSQSQKLVAKSQRLAHRALQLGVYNVLLALLDAEPFSGTSDLASIAHYCVYTVLSALLSIFHENTLGDSEVLKCIVTRLFKWEFIANSMWDKECSEGLTVVYSQAQAWFPLDFVGFMHYNISLARAGCFSAQQVKETLHVLHTYTELLDNNRSQDLQTTPEFGLFILRRHKHPYMNSDFMIERNSKGQVFHPSGGYERLSGGGPVIRWTSRYNGWQMLVAEIQELLLQVSQGAGTVQTDQLLRVSLVIELVKEVLTSDPRAATVLEFQEIYTLAYQIIARFSVLTPAPTELLSHSVQCLALAVPHSSTQVSHHLKQTGLLPFLTENMDNFSEVLSGEGINQGLYGCILATTECTQGTYSLTLAVLDLLTQLVLSSSKEGKEEEHMAAVLFILREVFPRFQKWRYVDTGQRKAIGQKCLQLYHKIFNFGHLQKKNEEKRKRGPTVQEACVFGLLFTEAGRALLDIVATGVDRVQLALAQQPSLMEGSGSDLVALVETSLSLLNRLLLLKPPGLGLSPVEQALASQPATTTTSTIGRQPQHHLVATVAQYIYHRHSHRLPTLATLLLKRLARVSPMSILACLGHEAEPIRDMYLTRLQAVSEDVQLKVGILELLSVCVSSQPGLLEIFLGVQQPDLRTSAASATSGGASKDLKLGRGSCLPILLDLMDVTKQCTYECPPDLLCACLDLVHSLWNGLRETPMTALRAKESFWSSVLAPLKSDLPAVAEDDPLGAQAFKLQIKLSAFSLRIVSMEIYAMCSSKLCSKFQTAIEETLTTERLKYWSKAMRRCVESCSQEDSDQEPPHLGPELSLTDHPALNLLLAWKNFLITVTRFKVLEKSITDPLRSEFLHDLIRGLRSQFASESLSQLKVKVASICSALAFTLVKLWGREVLDGQMSGSASSPAHTIKELCECLKQSLAVCDQLVPSVHIGLLGTATAILQNCGSRLEERQELVRMLLPEVCSVFLQSLWILPSLIEKEAEEGGEVQGGEEAHSEEDSDGAGGARRKGSLSSYLKLQMVSCSLLKEILQASPDVCSSLKVIEQSGIVPSILVTTESFIKSKRGVSFIYSSLQLLLKIADSEMGANTLLLSNLTSHLCLTLTLCYMGEEAYQPKNLINKTFTPTSGTVTVSWHSVYCLGLDLFARMLSVLGHSFLEDALNLVGTHQDRMWQALEVSRVSLSQTALMEAQSTVHFLLQLCPYHRQWRFQLPDVLARLMGSLTALIQSYVALLIRPRYLSHILEHHRHQARGGGVGSRSDTILQTPTYLQQQTSLDDVDQPSSKLVQAQTSMLKLVGLGLACLKHFTPALPEILFDQSIDVTEWEPILIVGFGTPALDDVEGISFGTLLYCVTSCLRQLAKGEGPRSVSPHRASPKSEDTSSVPKSVVNFALESALYILMSQACRYLRDPGLQPQGRQFIKRELGTELNSFLSSLHRQLRRGDRASSLTPPQAVPSTPQTSTPTGTGTTSTTPQLSRSVSVASFSGAHDPAFLRLVQAYVNKVLR